MPRITFYGYNFVLAISPQGKTLREVKKAYQYFAHGLRQAERIERDRKFLASLNGRRKYAITRGQYTGHSHIPQMTQFDGISLLPRIFMSAAIRW